MSKPLRFVLFAAFLLFVPLLTVRADAADVNASLKYVPSDAIAVSAIDVDKMRKSPLFKFLEEAIRREGDAKRVLEQMKKEAGFDPLKHLHSVVFIVPPEMMQDDENFAMVLEITGNEKKMVDAINKKSPVTKKETANGPVYSSDNGRGAFAFRGKHLIVGASAMVDKVLAAGAKPAAPFADLRSQVEKHDAWFVGKTTAELKKQLGKEGGPALAKLSRYAFGASFSPGVTVTGKASFDDATAAADAAKLANGGLVQAKNDALVARLGFADILGRVKVEQTGNDVKLSGDVTAAELQKIGKTLESMK